MIEDIGGLMVCGGKPEGGIGRSSVDTDPIKRAWPSQIGTLALSRKRCDTGLYACKWRLAGQGSRARRSVHEAITGNRANLMACCENTAAAESGTVRYLPEIMEDDVQVGWGGRFPLQVCIDDPPAGFDGGIVSEIVRGFENDPGRIQGFVRLRFIGTNTEAVACRCAECESVHCQYSSANFR
jgi:hypothetical protein